MMLLAYLVSYIAAVVVMSWVAIKIWRWVDRRLEII